MYSWWWELSTQELERTIQEEKRSWAGYHHEKVTKGKCQMLEDFDIHDIRGNTPELYIYLLAHTAKRT